MRSLADVKRSALFTSFSLLWTRSAEADVTGKVTAIFNSLARWPYTSVKLCSYRKPPTQFSEFLAILLSEIWCMQLIQTGLSTPQHWCHIVTVQGGKLLNCLDRWWCIESNCRAATPLIMDSNGSYLVRGDQQLGGQWWLVIEYGGPQGEWGATYPDFSCQFSANSTNDLEGKWEVQTPRGHAPGRLHHTLPCPSVP